MAQSFDRKHTSATVCPRCPLPVARCLIMREFWNDFRMKLIKTYFSTCLCSPSN